jgi:heptosyltransferase-3
VLSRNNDVDNVIAVIHRSSFIQSIRFLMSIWRKYDLALSAMSSDRPTIYARVAGKYCIGEVDPGGKHQWKRWLLSRTVETDNLNMHTVLMHLKLADMLSIPRCHEVVMKWDAQDEAAVHAALPFDISLQPYVVLHVYPKYSYKAWNNEAWIALAVWLNARGFRIILSGGSDEHESTGLRQLSALMPIDTINLAGKLCFPCLAYLLSKAKAYVGPDTVVTHLAAAMGTPTVALFGPTNAIKWGPWPAKYEFDANPFVMRGTQHVNNVILLQDESDCVPCMFEGCDRHISSSSDCLQNLPVQKVVQALGELGIR